MPRVALLDLPLTLTTPAPDEQRALMGDREAWGALARRHSPRVLTALLARGVRLAVARELVQDTWVRLMAQAQHRKLDRLELPGLAIRQALFLARSEARAVSPEGPLPELEARDEEARMLSRDALLRAATVLGRCAPMAQRVFTLAYQAPALSHAEIAERVGLSTQRVKQLICEVRAELRQSLEGDES